MTLCLWFGSENFWKNFSRLPWALVERVLFLLVEGRGHLPSERVLVLWLQYSVQFAEVKPEDQENRSLTVSNKKTREIRKEQVRKH